jgi:ATP-binding cassette subfamily F protein uup
MDNLAEGKQEVMVNGKPRHVLGYLQDFLFHPKRAMTPVRALSGGERNRLLLARLFLKPSNLLILDEPTNDLDVETLELLEELIDGYQGTVMLVSHDRQFVDNTVTECWIFEGEGRIGNTSAAITTPAVSRRSIWRKSSRFPKTVEVAQPKAESVKRAGKLSYNLQRELEQLPQSWNWKPSCKHCRSRLPILLSLASRMTIRSRCWHSWPKRNRRWKRPLNAGNISKD